MKNNYDDIINFPHHVSETRPRMAMIDRGAQFSPFAALTGFEAAIEETGRITDRKMELEEDEKKFLDEKLRIIQGNLETAPVVTVTFFEPDPQKIGGAYKTLTSAVRQIDTLGQNLIFVDETRIPLENILKMEGKILESVDI